MAGDRTLYLHVGTHKTGTTSVQHALQACRAALLAQGLGVWPEANAGALAHLFLRQSLVTPLRLRGQGMPGIAELKSAWEDFGAKITGERGLVISAEAFCHLREPAEYLALTAFFGRYFGRIVPVVALRNEADWRAAREDQMRKIGIFDAIRAFPDAQRCNGEWYYDRAALIRFWGEVGTPEVLDYDACRAAEGSILPAFARAIGAAGAFGGLDVWLNRRSA